MTIDDLILCFIKVREKKCLRTIFCFVHTFPLQCFRLGDPNEYIFTHWHNFLTFVNQVIDRFGPSTLLAYCCRCPSL